MKSIVRADLSPKSTAFLSRRTKKVKGAAEPVAEAHRLWGQRQNSAFREVREKLNGMATGRERCMYCEDNQGSDIDHFHPQHSHPHLAFDWDNYLLACSICNSNFKRGFFPVDSAGQPLLINPTAEDPLDHLVLTSQGQIVHQSDKGRHSIEVFQLDRDVLVLGRKGAWVALTHLIPCYAEALAEGDMGRAQEIEETVRRYPFASVLVHLLRTARSVNATALLSPKLLRALESCPEIRGWT